jgi:hypothetical protein
MADTRITPLEITRKFLAVFHSNCILAKNLNHDYEKNFGSQMGFDGQKIGPTLNIRDPIQANVRSTWAMQQQDITETYHTLTIDTVRGVDLKFSDADLALSIDDFVPRYIESPAKKLAAVVDQYCATYMLNQIAHAAAVTAFAVPVTVDAYLGASAMLKDALVPWEDGISVGISPTMERKIVGGLAGQYNPQMVISELFMKGQMSQAAGLDWYMSQIIPSITVGTTLNSDTPLVGTFVAASPAALPYTSSTAGGTWAAGQTFTIADLYDVNFETKTPLANLKQFVVTTAYTDLGGGTGTLAISPSIVFDTTSPVQNCYVAGGSINSKAMVLGCLDGVTSVPNTAASTVYQQGLVWHKDAFAFASVPLIQPKGLDMASTVTVDNLSFRFLRGYDIANARMLSRMDIFFGIAAIRQQWAAKIWTI